MIELGFHKQLVFHLQSELQLSQVASIDEFLAMRTDFTELGKAAIAYHMINLEDPRKLYGIANEDAKWFKILRPAIQTATQNQFLESPVRFITFNYDRSLDLLIFNALETKVGALNSDCKNFLCDEFIIHIHGMLDELHEIGGKGRKYENEIYPGSVPAAAAAIKVMHEASDADYGVQKAREIIANAEKVFFLGFGFHERNVARLQQHACTVPHLYGTGFGLTHAEVTRAQAIVHRQNPNMTLSLSPTDMDVLNYLRDNHRWQL